jgi:hypothetical protein
MDKVIPALIVAAISSLTFVAYKHPKAYQKIFNPLAICFLITFIAVNAWNLSNTLTYSALIEYIEVGKIKDAKTAMENYQIPYWEMWMLLGSYFYLFFLTFLPRLLDEDKPVNK